jgi:hypothetical protein
LAFSGVFSPAESHHGILKGVMSTSRRYDCFISHASEDKELLVEPLAMELQRIGTRVWLDKFELSETTTLTSGGRYRRATVPLV